MIHDDFANSADRQRTIECRRGTFAGDVAKHKPQAALSIGQKVIEVTAQFTRRDVGGRKIETGHFLRAVWQQLHLDFPCGIEVVAKPPLILASFLIETGIFKRDGHIAAESCEHPLMFQRKGMWLLAFQIEQADEAVLHEKRYDDFGTSFHAGITADVARIVCDVADAQDAPFSGGGSGETFMQRDPQACRNGIAATHRENTFQMLRLFVPEHDAENVILDDFLDALSDAAEELFAVENGSHLSADLVE